MELYVIVYNGYLCGEMRSHAEAFAPPMGFEKTRASSEFFPGALMIAPPPTYIVNSRGDPMSIAVAKLFG